MRLLGKVMFKLPFSIYADDIKWISYLILRLMEPLELLWIWAPVKPIPNPFERSLQTARARLDLMDKMWHVKFISRQTLLNDWLICKQKCNNFGYLSIQVWLKGNDKEMQVNLYSMAFTNFGIIKPITLLGYGMVS